MNASVWQTYPITLSREDEAKRSSQNGEDGVIASILNEMPAADGTFIELGAGDGFEGNCVWLACNDNAGLFVEADPATYAALAERWVGWPQVATRCERVIAENVNDIIAGSGLEPTVLSLDIDGNDYWVWQALEVVRPALVVVEYNASLGGRMVVQPYDPLWRWDGTDFFGASLPALVALGRRKGYRCVYAESSGTNAFFVRGDVSGVFTDADGGTVLGRPALPADPLGREYVDVT